MLCIIEIKNNRGMKHTVFSGSMEDSYVEKLEEAVRKNREWRQWVYQ